MTPFLPLILLAIVYNKAHFATATKTTNVGKLDAMGEPRFLENVKLFFGRAASKTQIPADIFAYIQACKSVVRFNIPLRMDDGSIRTVPCYR